MSARVIITLKNETNPSVVGAADVLLFQAPTDFRRPNLKSAVLAKLALHAGGSQLALTLPVDFTVGVLYRPQHSSATVKSARYQTINGDVWEFSDTSATLNKINTSSNPHITVRNSVLSKNSVDAALYKNDLLVSETTGIAPANQSEINVDNHSIYLVVQQANAFQVGDTFDASSMISKSIRFTLESQLTIRAFTESGNQIVRFVAENSTNRSQITPPPIISSSSSSNLFMPSNATSSSGSGGSSSGSGATATAAAGQNEFQLFQNYRMFKEFQMFQMFKEFQEYQAFIHSKGNQ